MQNRDVVVPEAPLCDLRDAFDRSVALIMGVNAYGRGVPGLRTAVPDSEAIGGHLETEHGFTTVLLRDGEVCRKRLRELLVTKLRSALGAELGERDRLILYFAGHGLSLPSEHGPEGQLLLADADPSDPSTFFAMSELRALIGNLPCRHLLIVLDCCFAGTFRWAGRGGDRHAGGRVYRETLDRFVCHRSWQVLVSATHDQMAQDAVSSRPASASLTPEVVGALRTSRIETESHSPFAAALLSALRGAADYTGDHLVVAAELELFVRDAVERATQVRQTPQLYKLEQHDGGEFVFQVPGTALDLSHAPALSPAACPYQGFAPYTVAQRARFFGRARATAELIARVQANPLTVVLGASGAGKSSLLAAGLVPALCDMPGWVVIASRPDAAALDLVEVPVVGLRPGGSLFERITAWLSIHVHDQLCLVIDQVEELEILATPKARDQVLGGLAQTLEAHPARVRIVLALRSELTSEFRSSALAPWWDDAVFAVPALAHHELREIIESPARELELVFEPASLVDMLIDEVLQAPGGLPLLSFALQELYLRSAERNCDRLLTADDYARMGGLQGVLSERASEVLRQLVARDPAYEATARRVFLRMVAERDGAWLRQRVHRNDLVYADDAENQRAATLLAAFRDARLIVFDKETWEPAHDCLVRGWAQLSMWRTQFGATALGLQSQLAGAAQHWQSRRRSAELWVDDARLPVLRSALRSPDSWLNARERAFLAASLRRQRVRGCATLAVLGLAIVAGLAGWDLYYRAHVDYFCDYGRRWGAPEGIDALSESEAQGRATAVKLVRYGHLGRVVHVELMHDADELADELARANWRASSHRPELALGKTAAERVPYCWDFAYDSVSDAVSTETASDRTGRVVYRLQYRSGSPARSKAEFIDENGNDASIASGSAERVEFIRSTTGRDLEKHYLGRHGEHALNQDGISVERLDYDEPGHVVRRRYFDKVGAPTRDNAGFGGWWSSFDARSNETERAYVDEAGRSTRLKDGIAGWRSRFDARGNEVERAFIDEVGKPTRHKSGIATYRSRYDAHGNEIERAYLDEAGRPTRGKQRVAGWRTAYDAGGHATKVTYLDEAGQPTHNKEGYAGYRAMFDARGNEIEVTYFDASGKPTCSNNGYAGYLSTFDARGNETERAYVDTSGRPTLGSERVAGYRSTFDAQDNEVEVRYFDERGRPIRHIEGVAGWRVTFHPRDHRAEVTYIDEDGEPAWSKEGLAGYVSTLDAHDNEIQRSYVDDAGNPTLSKEGVAGYRSTFDARGNESTRTFFDVPGESAIHKGVARYRSQVDIRGNEIERAYFDETDRPTPAEHGVATYRTLFDARGNVIERRYFDGAGKAVGGPDGVPGYRATFDVQGNEISIVYIDETGQPTQSDDSVAGHLATFDARGNETMVRFIDEAGNPTLNKEGVAGFLSTCDARGNELERRFFDEAGHPTRSHDGFAGWRTTFDSRGNPIDYMRLDERGVLTQPDGSYAGWRSRFDPRDNEIERTLYGADSAPDRTIDIATLRIAYNSRGAPIGSIISDRDGISRPGPDGLRPPAARCR